MAKHSQFKGEEREIGKKNLLNIRKAAKIPAVVYGNKTKPINITIHLNDFIRLYKEAGTTKVIDLEIAGKKLTVLIHDIDVDPVKVEPRHVDFKVVNLKVEVETEVPIELVGEAPVLKAYNALISQNMDTLEVKALPDNLPKSIKVDVSSLVELSDNIKVSDIEIRKNFVILNESDEVVASVNEIEEFVETAPEAPSIIEEANNGGESNEGEKTPKVDPGEKKE